MSFSGSGNQNCGQLVTVTPMLMGYIKASAFNRLKWHSQFGVFFMLSVACHIRVLFMSKVKKQLKAKDLQSPLALGLERR